MTNYPTTNTNQLAEAANMISLAALGWRMEVENVGIKNTLGSIFITVQKLKYNSVCYRIFNKNLFQKWIREIIHIFLRAGLRN
jgi:hypothetical protein